MKDNNEGLCSAMERNRLKISIFDAVDEWKTYYGCSSEMGLAIDLGTFDVKVCPEEIADSCEWVSMETLLFNGEVDADQILDLVDQFCFVK